MQAAQYREESYLRHGRSMPTPTMKSLRLAMIAHGIPARCTHTFAEDLDIKSVEDLREMPIYAVLFVPINFRQNIINLRNFYKHDGDEMWYVPADADWPAINTHFAHAFLQLFPDV
jgi:hypothetical protein